MADTWGDNFIQAYLGGVKTRLEKEGQLAQQQQFNDNLKQNQDRLKMEMQHVDQLHQAELARQGFETENLKSKILDQFKSGTRVAPPALQNPVMPGQQDVQLSPVSMVNQQPQEATINQGPSYIGTSTPDPTQYVDVDPRLGTGGSLKIEGATTPDVVDKRTLKERMLDAQVAIAKAAGIKQAEAPIVRETDRLKNEGLTAGKLQVVAKQGENAAAIREAQDAAKLDQIKLTGGYQIAAANIRANATKYATDHKTSGGLDPSTLHDNAMLAATGQSSIPGYTNNGMAVKSVLKQSGLVPFDPKDAEKLKSVNDTSVLYDNMVDYVSKLPDGKMGALLDKAAAKIPGTDAYNFHQAVFGRAANISHTYGGEIGRLSDPDVARAMGILVDSGITKQEALKRLQSLKLETTSKIFNHILGGQPTKQQLMNLETYKFDPESYVTKGSDGKLKPKFIKDGNDWREYDSKANAYNLVK